MSLAPAGGSAGQSIPGRGTGTSQRCRPEFRLQKCQTRLQKCQTRFKKCQTRLQKGQTHRARAHPSAPGWNSGSKRVKKTHPEHKGAEKPPGNVKCRLFIIFFFPPPAPFPTQSMMKISSLKKKKKKINCTTELLHPRSPPFPPLPPPKSSTKTYGK